MLPLVKAFFTVILSFPQAAAECQGAACQAPGDDVSLLQMTLDVDGQELTDKLTKLKQEQDDAGMHMKYIEYAKDQHESRLSKDCRTTQKGCFDCRTIRKGSYAFHSEGGADNRPHREAFNAMRKEAQDPWKQKTHSIWVTEFEQSSYLYLRLDQSKRGDQFGTIFQFVANTDIHLLNTARTNLLTPQSFADADGQNLENITASATGIKTLFDDLADNDMTTVDLWWYDLSVFDTFYEKNSKLNCTKKNILRIAFGIQGGLSSELVQGGCDKEPILTDKDKHDFSVSRWSRTDFDVVFVRILCDKGYDGYFSPILPQERSSSKLWGDHEKRFATTYTYQPYMFSEAFVCDASKLDDGRFLHMVHSEGRWAHGDGTDVIPNSFSEGTCSL